MTVLVVGVIVGAYALFLLWVWALCNAAADE